MLSHTAVGAPTVSKSASRCSGLPAARSLLGHGIISRSPGGGCRGLLAACQRGSNGSSGNSRGHSNGGGRARGCGGGGGGGGGGGEGGGAGGAGEGGDDDGHKVRVGHCPEAAVLTQHLKVRVPVPGTWGAPRPLHPHAHVGAAP